MEWSPGNFASVRFPPTTILEHHVGCEREACGFANARKGAVLVSAPLLWSYRTSVHKHDAVAMIGGIVCRNHVHARPGIEAQGFVKQAADTSLIDAAGPK
jgi:hypothetical protein